MFDSTIFSLKNVFIMFWTTLTENKHTPNFICKIMSHKCHIIFLYLVLVAHIAVSHVLQYAATLAAHRPIPLMR